MRVTRMPMRVRRLMAIAAAGAVFVAVLTVAAGCDSASGPAGCRAMTFGAVAAAGDTVRSNSNRSHARAYR